MNKMAELKQLHEAYITRVRSYGRKILLYTTPCCRRTVEGIAALPGEEWRTGATCPHCAQLYLKVSTEEAITAYSLDGELPPKTH